MQKNLRLKIQHPVLYEINTRVWVKQFSSGKKKNMLQNIPDFVWKDFADKGIHIIWLMGIWKTNTAITGKYCFEDYLMNL